MITPKQRQFLRGQAQKLAPQFQIGKFGITATVLQQIQNQINSQELLKITILKNSTVQAAELIQQVQAFDAKIEYVQDIGHTVVLYKRAPQSSKRRLSLEVEQLRR
ncbi:YhbY family RNA-binding protein [Bombilactobacillus bombi]|uniref:YhbY family RNA-binding protein n=1 Tax=Bombilactobacillus bombi TaxID=1303590 RepID=UPI0015E5EE50|nr:YhbY family RNA-binding protein [Bombilactobacillus bombi]MBA1434627.1 YhbY family RNA-binding protein [Bombilactobacillus bombi]